MSQNYILLIYQRKVIKEVLIRENYLNEIEVEKKFISKDLYIFTEKCLGIPLFVSIKNDHISFEHTHPPHHYILSKDRFKTVTRIKMRLKILLIDKLLRNSYAKKLRNFRY